MKAVKAEGDPGAIVGPKAVSEAAGGGEVSGAGGRGREAQATVSRAVASRAARREVAARGKP